MISIVTLSYNCSKQLIKTCNSILNQLVPPSEHIIIDNNSTDDTKYKIDKLSERYKNKGIELIFISEQDKGISDGFNKGISICKNPIIALLNSGDTYFETTIKVVIDNFGNTDEILFGNLQMEGSNKIILGDSKFRKKIKYFMPRLNHPALFVKKSVYDRIGSFSLNYQIAMDYDFLLRAYLGGIKFKYINNTLTIMEPDGISNTNKLKAHKETLTISKSKFICILSIVYSKLI